MKVTRDKIEQIANDPVLNRFLGPETFAWKGAIGARPTECGGVEPGVVHHPELSSECLDGLGMRANERGEVR